MDEDEDMADAPAPALAKQFSEAQIVRRVEIHEHTKAYLNEKKVLAEEAVAARKKRLAEEKLLADTIKTRKGLAEKQGKRVKFGSSC